MSNNHPELFAQNSSLQLGPRPSPPLWEASKFLCAAANEFHPAILLVWVGSCVCILFLKSKAESGREFCRIAVLCAFMNLRLLRPTVFHSGSAPECLWVSDLTRFFMFRVWRFLCGWAIGVCVVLVVRLVSIDLFKNCVPTNSHSTCHSTYYFETS